MQAYIVRFFFQPKKIVFFRCTSCFNMLNTQRRNDFICPAVSCGQKNKHSSLQMIFLKSSEEMELEKERNIRKDVLSQ